MENEDFDITAVKTRFKDAPPEKLIELASWGVNQVGRLSLSHRQSFMGSLDPSAKRLFEDQTQPA